MAGDINQITDNDVQEFGLQLGNRVFPNLMDEYQRIATKTAIYPGAKRPFGLAYVGLKLNGEAGEFAEHVGKAFRDDEFGKAYFQGTTPLTPERRQALLKELGDVLWYISAACNELEVTMSSVAIINLQKLNARTKKGTLGGSGDER